MKTHLAAALLILVCASDRAHAQNQTEGLDLTEEKKDESRTEEGKGDGLDLTEERRAPDAAEVRESAGEVEPVLEPVRDDGPRVERDVAQEDRVKSVQRKLYMKRGRFELAPAIAINVNDAYYTKWGGALRAAFYPADTLAISARFTLLDTVPTDDVRIAMRNLNSIIFFSEPRWSAMADAEWSPLYGKVAIFNSILHFDGYLVAGAGVMFTQTSANVLDPNRAGLKPAFDLGLGLRFVTTDWLAVNVGLINTNYVDVPVGTSKASLQNVMLVHAGVSVFFPFKSTFREAE